MDNNKYQAKLLSEICELSQIRQMLNRQQRNAVVQCVLDKLSVKQVLSCMKALNLHTATRVYYEAPTVSA